MSDTRNSKTLRVLCLWSEILESPESRRSFLDAGISCSVHCVRSPGIPEGLDRILELYDVIFVDARHRTVDDISTLAALISSEQRPPLILLVTPELSERQAELLESGADSVVSADPAGAFLMTAAVSIRKLSRLHRRDVERTGMGRWIRRLERERGAMLRSSFSLITYHGLDTRIAWSNAGSLPDEEDGGDHLAGRFCNEIWKMGGDTSEGCPVCETLETGEPSEKEVETLDGVKMIQRVQPVRDSSGELVGAVASTLDLHVLHPSEDFLVSVRRLQECAAVAGGIATRIGDLMTSVLESAEVASRALHGVVDAEAAMLDIESTARLAGELADQLLVMARGSDHPPRLFSLRDMLTEMIRLSEGPGGFLEGTTISTSLAPDLWNIMADPGQIAFAIGQILDHAAQVAPPGGALRLRAFNELVEEGEGEQAPGSYAVLVVEGAVEVMRADGMGLAAAMGAIEVQGGYISMSGATAEGASLAIYLPATNVEELRCSGCRPSVLVEG